MGYYNYYCQYCGIFVVDYYMYISGKYIGRLGLFFYFLDLLYYIIVFFIFMIEKVFVLVKCFFFLVILEICRYYLM